MALTGWPDQPLGPPEGLVEGIDRLAKPFPGLDALALLGERAALMGLWRRGDTSCGGSCRLLRCADGFMAVSLPRDEDMEMVPAWLELDSLPPSAPAVWATVATKLTGGDPQVLLDRARLVGLPVARVGAAAVSEARAPVLEARLGDAPPRRDMTGLVVIDLSALWAGPLCGDLLARAGATVVKVESTQRPDGARRGTREFLRSSQRAEAIRRPRPAEPSGHPGPPGTDQQSRHRHRGQPPPRPRAVRPRRRRHRHCGSGPQVWVSITGYGRTGEGANRVAFGDDAAAAGGLVVWTDDGPLFCADAVADPLTGLTAASACVDALRAGGRWLLDVSMAAVSADLAGPTLPTRHRARRRPHRMRAQRPREHRNSAPTPPTSSPSSASTPDPSQLQARFLTSVKSSSPCRPHSRPSPDCL